jgi:hypothetical protein
MFSSSKLKPETSVRMLLPALVTLVLMAVVMVQFGVRAGVLFVGCAFIVFSGFALLSAIRTRNAAYLVQTGWLLMFGLFQVAIFVWHPGSRIAQMFKIYAFVFLAWLIYLLITGKIKWRGREILELAARGIGTESGGFTERPKPLGKVEYTRAEREEFGTYLLRNLIAWPYFEDHQLVLVPLTMASSFPYLYGWTIPGYTGKTWIAFDDEGNVTVNISRADYLNFKDDLQFDELCTSLGSLYVDFLQRFQRGEHQRIVDQVNEVKVGFFS